MKPTPAEIDDVTLAFPATVVGSLLPKWEDIPDEFKKHGGTVWNQIVSTWFFQGLDGFPKVKDEFDQDKVIRHLSACMRSFEPKHEHKEAGVAYLMSLWCEPLEEAESGATV